MKRVFSNNNLIQNETSRYLPPSTSDALYKPIALANAYIPGRPNQNPITLMCSAQTPRNSIQSQEL
jgi:hypothetical protein